MLLLGQMEAALRLVTAFICPAVMRQDMPLRLRGRQRTCLLVTR